MINLLFPERTYVIAGERQRPFDPSNLASLGRVRVFILGWSQIKEVFDNIDVDIDSLKITARQVVPFANRLTNTFTRSPLLYSIVAYLADNNVAAGVDFVIFANGRIIRLSSSVGSHQC